MALTPVGGAGSIYSRSAIGGILTGGYDASNQWAKYGNINLRQAVFSASLGAFTVGYGSYLHGSQMINYPNMGTLGRYLMTEGAASYATAGPNIWYSMYPWR
jgi:hypothetical protein